MSQFDLRGIGMTSQRTRDRLVQRLREHGITDERVLTVIGEVPRHIFIDEALSTRAYEDTALPIGHGQTISQPFIVALMTKTLLNKGIVLAFGKENLQAAADEWKKVVALSPDSPEGQAARRALEGVEAAHARQGTTNQ